MYNFLGTFSSKDFEFAPIIAQDDLRESHSKMYCQITESYNIVQRYAIWEISHQKIKPTQQMENGRRWRDGLGREAPQATAANHPFPASDPHPSLSPIHWVCQVRLSNQFSSQVSGKTFSQLVWLSYAIQMLLQLTFLNQCNLTTRGLMSVIWTKSKRTAAFFMRTSLRTGTNILSQFECSISLQVFVMSERRAAHGRRASTEDSTDQECAFPLQVHNRSTMHNGPAVI